MNNISNAIVCYKESLEAEKFLAGIAENYLFSPASSHGHTIEFEIKRLIPIYKFVFSNNAYTGLMHFPDENIQRTVVHETDAADHKRWSFAMNSCGSYVAQVESQYKKDSSQDK